MIHPILTYIFAPVLDRTTGWPLGTSLFTHHKTLLHNALTLKRNPLNGDNKSSLVRGKTPFFSYENLLGTPSTSRLRILCFEWWEWFHHGLPVCFGKRFFFFFYFANFCNICRLYSNFHLLNFIFPSLDFILTESQVSGSSDYKPYSTPFYILKFWSKAVGVFAYSMMLFFLMSLIWNLQKFPLYVSGFLPIYNCTHLFCNMSPNSTDLSYLFDILYYKLVRELSLIF